MTTKKKYAVLLWVVCSVVICVLVGSLHPQWRHCVLRVQGEQLIQKEALDQVLNPLKTTHVLKLWLTDQFANTLMGAFPMIHTVEVNYHWPNQLTATIAEKKPWVCFYKTKESVLIASDGTVLTRHQDIPLTQSEDVIIIKGFVDTFFTNNALNITMLNHIKEVITSIKTNIQDKDLQLEVLDNGQWVLLRNDTLPIYLGELTDLPQKFTLLNHFNAHYKTTSQKPLAYLDLRVPNRVFVAYETP